MFDQLRRGIKPIIWITTFAFVIGFGFIILSDVDFSLGRNKARLLAQGQIGSVNGDPIYFRTYEQLMNQARMNYRQQTGTDLDARAEVMLRDQAWGEIIQEMILMQEAKRRGVRASDEEVRFAAFNQPPGEVMQNPLFMTNGQFDPSKYIAMLQDPGFDTRGLEEHYRRIIPTQKMQMQVLGSVIVSDLEVREAFDAQNEKIQVSYLMVPAGRFSVDEESVSEQMLQRHYSGRSSQYRVPPQAVLQFVTVERRYSLEDSLNLIQTARQILSDHAEGDDFGILVRSYSEAPPDRRGGDEAGWLSAADIADQTVRDAAFSLGVGEVSDILVTRNGVHIVRVEDRRTGETGEDQVRIAEIAMSLDVSRETLSDLVDMVRSFRQEVTTRDFEEVAAEMGLTVRLTQPFTETGFIPGLGSVPEIQEFTFSRPVGSVTPPVVRADGWVVARIAERRGERVPELNEVMDRVRREVLDSLRVDQAMEVAQGLLRSFLDGADMGRLAEDDERVSFDTTEPFSRLGFPRGIGGDPLVIGRLFASGPGPIPEVIRGRNAAFVARIDERIPADDDEFEAQMEQQRQRILARKQNLVMNDWMAGLRRKARIEDYRYGIFD